MRTNAEGTEDAGEDDGDNAEDDTPDTPDTDDTDDTPDTDEGDGEDSGDDTDGDEDAEGEDGPSLEFTSPGMNSFLFGLVTIMVNADSADGISGVTFYIDGEEVGEAASPPYMHDWNSDNAAEGAHTIRVDATDNAGAVSSKELTVFIDRSPPSVGIQSPLSEAFEDTLLLEATAEDNFVVSRIEWHIISAEAEVIFDPETSALIEPAGAPFHTMYTAPYTAEVSLEAVELGSHDIIAVAYDGAGLASFDRSQFNRRLDPSATPEGFVRIEAGTFLMGSGDEDEQRYANEVQHEVVLTRAFFMKETVVTQDEWHALMGNHPSHFDECGDDCPMDSASWWDAVTFANALSRLEGLDECYNLAGCVGELGVDYECTAGGVIADEGNPYLCEGYRLPTEAEWEYAARAGKNAATYMGNIGDNTCTDETLLAIAWFCGNSEESTHPVAQLEPNDWGLYDMLGNVREWTGDWQADYVGDATDPYGPAGGTNRIARGGDWQQYPKEVRAARRFARRPEYRQAGYFGIRLVRTVP